MIMSNYPEGSIEKWIEDRKACMAKKADGKSKSTMLNVYDIWIGWGPKTKPVFAKYWVAAHDEKQAFGLVFEDWTTEIQCFGLEKLNGHVEFGEPRILAKQIPGV